LKRALFETKMQPSIQNLHKQTVHKAMINKHLLMGYLFLALVFLGAISSVYYWQSKDAAARQAELLSMPRHVGSGEQETGDNSAFCAQVITPAKNNLTGEIRNFPTPCDVPKDWQVVNQ
jgi:hypothetical protein